MNQMETKDKNNANESDKLIKSATSDEYKYGFTSDIDTDIIPVGLNRKWSASYRPKRESLNGFSTSV